MSSSQTTTQQQTDDLAAVVEALRSNDRFLVTTHENPDGDALGSLLATTVALRDLGKDVVMFLDGVAPVPREYANVLNCFRVGPWLAWMPTAGLMRLRITTLSGVVLIEGGDKARFSSAPARVTHALWLKPCER